MSFTEKYSDKDVDDFDAWCDYMEKHEDDPEAMTWKEWKERNGRRDIENESDQRNRKNSFDVAHSVVNSGTYSKSFNKLEESPKVTRAIKSSVKEILNHRTGTNYEDLAYIDSETGDALIQKQFDKPKKVAPTKKMQEMVLNKPNTIIAIHNHPSSSLPSMSDIWSARRYKYGLIVGHDGTVIKYEVSDKLKKEDLIYIDDLMGDLERNKFLSNFNEQEKLLQNLESVGVKLSWINET